MDMFTFGLGEPPYQIQITALPMGQDWNISITGGTHSHLGAAALAVPYPKEDGGVSASTSVLTAPTHKEDLIARTAAERLAKQLNCTVLVSCGIHVDHIAPNRIHAFSTLVEEAVSLLCARLNPSVNGS